VSHSPGHRRRRDRLLGLLLRMLSAALGGRAWRTVQAFGRAVGSLGFRLSSRERRRTLEHLALAMPQLGDEARRRLAREVFRNQGMNLAECLALLHRDCADVAALVDAEGWEAVQEARAEGRRILILTGHCGNWELLGAWLNCHGLSVEVVARAVDTERLNELLLSLRQRFGTETIERSSPGAGRRLLRVLREGRVLALLIDQDTRVEGVWVPFFGRPAYTPVGAAKIALKQDAAVFPTFIERLPDGRHRIRIHPPLALPPDPTAATALMTAAIEEQVRRVPAQWVWMHRRWRRQPGDTTVSSEK
jgi:KDO2-lipid IV(A) lauroyltransferase